MHGDGEPGPSGQSFKACQCAYFIGLHRKTGDTRRVRGHHGIEHGLEAAVPRLIGGAGGLPRGLQLRQERGIVEALQGA